MSDRKPLTITQTTVTLVVHDVACSCGWSFTADTYDEVFRAGNTHGQEMHQPDGAWFVSGTRQVSR